MAEQIEPNRHGAPIAAASVTSATTAFVVWTVDRLVFHGGGMPPEVYGFLQIAVPSAMGFLGAEFVYWRQQRRRT